MRASLLGHACLILEAGATRVITDPLFFGPGERTLDPCPKRVVHVDELGAFDAIVISHRHLDHFDAESLARLDRRLPMFMPRDEELASRARAKCFAKVTQLAPWDEVGIGDFHLMVTPSHRHDVAEMGMVFIAPDAALWNQVDTVVDQATCLRVLKRTNGALDVVFCAYNPLLEHATMWYAETDFPQARYERLLEMAACSEARLVVPGSFGLRMVGKYAHFNQRCYPVSRERFVADFAKLAPEREAWILNPGDGVEVERAQPPRKVAVPYATTLEDDTALTRFAPETPMPELVDENPTRFPDRELEHIVMRVWPKIAAEVLAKGEGGPLLTLRSRRATVDFEVVLPRRRRRFRLLRWSPALELAEVAPDDHDGADYTFTYVASQVYGVAVGRPYQVPEVLARRSGKTRPDGLTPIDPARLAGVDAYSTTDENSGWSPLDILEGRRL